MQNSASPAKPAGNDKALRDHVLYLLRGGGAHLNFDQAVAGLLSEPGFFYASYKSRLWSMWLLSSWWTVWWGVMLWRNWP